MSSVKTEAEAVADLVKSFDKEAKVIPVTSPTGVEVNILTLPRGDSIVTESIKKYIDEWRTEPERREGTATMTDINSFIAHVNRFKTSESAIFADSNKSQPGLLAVLDYHEAVNVGEALNLDAQAQFCRHRTQYKFPVSQEWKDWNENNGRKMTQGEFAVFIEEHIRDVLVPPTFQGELSEQDQKLLKDVTLLTGRLAGPEKLMALSRGFAVTETSKVLSVTNLSTGEYNVAFGAEHADEEGQKLDVPSMFLIGIPVFDNGPAYRVQVRLRYRKGSSVTWFYEMFQQKEAFKDAIKDACQQAEEGTGLPLFVGSPEKIITE